MPHAVPNGSRMRSTVILYQPTPLALNCSGTTSDTNALSKLHGMLLTASAVEADGLSCSRADNAIAADDVENRPIDADS
jgi:hypothetical protein